MVPRLMLLTMMCIVSFVGGRLSEIYAGYFNKSIINQGDIFVSSKVHTNLGKLL